MPPKKDAKMGGDDLRVEALEALEPLKGKIDQLRTKVEGSTKVEGYNFRHGMSGMKIGIKEEAKTVEAIKDNLWRLKR